VWNGANGRVGDSASGTPKWFSVQKMRVKILGVEMGEVGNGGSERVGE